MARLRKTVLEEKQEALVHLIKYKMDVYHIPSRENLATRIGITERSLINRFKNPRMFRIGEVQILCEILHFDENERLKILWVITVIAVKDAFIVARYGMLVCKEKGILTATYARSATLNAKEYFGISLDLLLWCILWLEYQLSLQQLRTYRGGNMENVLIVGIICGTIYKLAELVFGLRHKKSRHQNRHFGSDK